MFYKLFNIVDNIDNPIFCFFFLYDVISIEVGPTE